MFHCSTSIFDRIRFLVFQKKKHQQKKVDYMWVFPKIGVPPNGWFIMENPIKMDDLGITVFLETPIWITRIFEASKVSSKSTIHKTPGSFPVFELGNPLLQIKPRPPAAWNFPKIKPLKSTPTMDMSEFTTISKCHEL